MWVHVRVTNEKKITLSFPVPLFVLDELLDCSLDLLTVVLFFVPKKARLCGKEYLSPEVLQEVLESTRILLKSLKEHGPFDLVDVTTKEAQVLIKIL